MLLLTPHEEQSRRRCRREGRLARASTADGDGPSALILSLTLMVISGAASLSAQEERKHKVPIADKVSSGFSRQAFSGKVQSLDLERKLLNVDTVLGSNTEIFPVTKGVRVASADGAKLKLKALAPGTNVLIYYEQKGDQRTVKEIVVLAAGSTQARKPAPPS